MAFECISAGRVTMSFSVRMRLRSKQIWLQYVTHYNERKRKMEYVKYLGCWPSSCGFEAECGPVLGLTQVFLALPLIYTAPHPPGGSTQTRWIKPVSPRMVLHFKINRNRNLWWSLLTLPPAYRCVRAWALCSTPLSLFPLSLQEDGLSSAPVLQSEVADGFAEVLGFGVSHHRSGVAEE